MSLCDGTTTQNMYAASVYVNKGKLTLQKLDHLVHLVGEKSCARVYYSLSRRDQNGLCMQGKTCCFIYLQKNLSGD